MKSLSNYIIEASQPKFSNSEEGINAFCEYVFRDSIYSGVGDINSPKQIEWVINPDKTIKVTIPSKSKTVTLWTKDLIEIPDFIIFKDIQGIRLSLPDNSKVKNWAPKVIGGCDGIILDGNKKIQTLDLNECPINKGGLLSISSTSLQSIEGGNGEDVQIHIRKNSKLTDLDLSGIKSYGHGSTITNNKKLVVKKNLVPKKIDGDSFFEIEKNGGGYETSGTLTYWDKEV
jgi:hypothetical protein